MSCGLWVMGFPMTAVPVSAQDSFGGPPVAQPAPNPPAPAGASPRTPVPGAAEQQDFGVKATSELHAGSMHGPTPATIPGGQVITTRGLVALLANQQVKARVFDILGGPEVIPGALPAVPAHQAGSFNDQTQREFGQFLQQVTQGDRQTPLVFYCLSNQCWMSYNASLRAISLGYRNVLWYRGGIEAWKAGGQQVQRQE